MWKCMAHPPFSSKRDRMGSITDPEMKEVISLPSTGSPSFPHAIFSSASLLSNLKQFSEKCENKPEVLLPSRCLLGPCNVPSGSGNQAWKVMKHYVKGDPEGSFLQFVVLVVKICGRIYWHKYSPLPCFCVLTLLPVCEGVLRSQSSSCLHDFFIYICFVLTFIFFLRKIKGVDQTIYSYHIF